ncbi:hypothetical protein VNO78_19694 [Psophocarpus tetragonolobus]|uniref:Uncharacterized protein n=1 Tax=Psophocarpus tetragonolobus TaxID=3891 RepID=A0AAN9S9V7_PSOTE
MAKVFMDLGWARAVRAAGRLRWKDRKPWQFCARAPVVNLLKDKEMIPTEGAVCAHFRFPFNSSKRDTMADELAM